MNGLMMHYPLTLDRILARAQKNFPEQEIVSRLADGSLHRYTYGEFYTRTLKLMQALRRMGVRPGDRVATFAWNSYRHMELYFAVPALGAVLHTLNIRLFPEQLVYIVNHAEDQFIFCDKSLMKPLADLAAQFKTVKQFIVIDDRSPEVGIKLKGMTDYEALIQNESAVENFLQFDENTAASMCYTSGTTGEPKGVLYSHRSIFLHAMGISMSDTLAVSGRDTILPVVPMFHVMSWGIPFAACLTGAKMVYPGSQLIGKPIAELIEHEKVTLAAGVPTIWNVLLQHLKKDKADISSLRAMVVGGSAAPPALIAAYEKEHGVQILHAWGMTETSPLGSVAQLKPYMQNWGADALLKQRAKQGKVVPLVEARIVDDAGKELAWDGKASGELQVRGPWIASSYYNMESQDAGAAFTADGWFGTGDVARIDEHGFIEITDRKKDLIKTRGEWLSSVEMENTAMAFQGVAEAAVVGRPDDVRGEAAVLFLTPLPDKKDTFDMKALHAYLSEKFAHWQVPKLVDMHIIDAIPKTSVGKFDKKVLRARL
ncbi:MAG: long-chain fatty acid--CoA ligase [Spirochaetes bacterium]|nr:long-chain fatty acid--CoA ligase [Spirochaetota bacterium]